MLRDNNGFSRILRIGVGIFFLLSITDFLITWKLVAEANMEVDEVNPLASWILQQFGWGGLAVYKLTLVSFIAALVVAITYRKRAVGEAVLMFGCGAQASVVVTSLLLLHGSTPVEPSNTSDVPFESQLLDSGGFLPLGGYAMLTQSFVQKELGLPTDTIKQIEAITKKRRELHQKLRAENIVAAFDLFHEQYDQERLLGASLSPRQLKRLQEICWQARGPMAFFDRDVVALLEFSESQVEDLNQIREAGQWHNVLYINEANARSPVVAPNLDMVEVSDRLLTILDATQRKKWQAMQGERFTFDLQSATLNASPAAAIAE